MGFQLTFKNHYTTKDQNKATVANKFIGYSVNGCKRATEQYAIDAANQNIPINCGEYTSHDIVFVSVNGGEYGTATNFQKTVAEIDLALQAGASIITDNATNAHRKYNNREFGEGGLRRHLLTTYPPIKECEFESYSIWVLSENITLN